MTANEITVGTRVAIVRYRGDPSMVVNETKVTKVYKNGNVVLESEPGQQFKTVSYCSYDEKEVPQTYLHRTGDHLSSRHVTFMIWTENVDREIAEVATLQVRELAIKQFYEVTECLKHRNACRRKFDPVALNAITEQLKTLLKVEE